ncbi:MAG: sugar porter family MFS transporter [Terracidiphilus sp.]|nr:sugar porter family MFS transporter [Terracidiphilus sp.]
MTETFNSRYVLFLACTAALGGLLFGFDIAIITGAGPFLIREFSLSDLGLGWAFSSLLFGCVLGSFLAGRFTGRYGRKKLLVIVGVSFAVTSIATASSTGFPSFVIARFLGGLAVGAVSLLSPMYAAEVSPPAVRGRVGALYQMSIVTGILVSYGVNYLLRNTGTNNWRWMFLSGVAPSAVFLLLIALAPESPRFLAMNGRVREAFLLLERIGGTNAAQIQIAEITATMHTESKPWRGLLRPGVRRALAVSAGLAILIHVSGINTIVDYAPSIFQSAGWKIEGALASTILVGVTEFLFTIVSFWMIDRFGRKPLYIVGSFGMALCLFLLLTAVLTGRFHGAVVLMLILSYLAFFCACIGPVFWTLVPEIFPNDVRGLAMTVPVLTQWVANAFVVLLFPFAFHVIGKSFTFGFLAVMALAQGIFTWRLVPETRNKALEEMEGHWTASIGAVAAPSD